MPKSTIHTIKSKLGELYPDLTSQDLDILIETYFNEVKQSIRNPQTPEITFLFGTLKPRIYLVTKAVEYYNEQYKEEDFKNSKKGINAQSQYENFKRILDKHYETLYHGKTSRGIRRKLNRKITRDERNNTLQ